MFKVKLIHIGTIKEPVGLKGEIKVKTYSSNFKSFVCCGRVVNEDFSKIWNAKLVRETKNYMVVKMLNVDTRNEAESLKGKKLFVERINLPKTKKDEFYIVDLINCKVLLNNKKFLGFVNNIENYGAGNLIDIKQKNNKNFLLPMNKENIVSIDIKKKIIIVDPIKGIIN